MTVVVAVLALGLSVVSLGWQIRTHFLAGPRIRVGMGHAIFTGTGRECVSVTAVNRGRMSANVRSIDVQVDRTKRHSPITMSEIFPPSSDELPTRIAPHDSATWYVPEQVMAWIARDAGVPRSQLRAYVTLGDGKRVYQTRR